MKLPTKEQLQELSTHLDTMREMLDHAQILAEQPPRVRNVLWQECLTQFGCISDVLAKMDREAPEVELPKPSTPQRVLTPKVKAKVTRPPAPEKPVKPLMTESSGERLYGRCRNTMYDMTSEKGGFHTFSMAQVYALVQAIQDSGFTFFTPARVRRHMGDSYKDTFGSRQRCSTILLWMAYRGILRGNSRRGYSFKDKRSLPAMLKHAWESTPEISVTPQASNKQMLQDAVRGGTPTPVETPKPPVAPMAPVTEPSHYIEGDRLPENQRDRYVRKGWECLKIERSQWHIIPESVITPLIKALREQNGGVGTPVLTGFSKNTITKARYWLMHMGLLDKRNVPVPGAETAWQAVWASMPVCLEREKWCRTLGGESLVRIRINRAIPGHTDKAARKKAPKAPSPDLDKFFVQVHRGNRVLRHESSSLGYIRELVMRMAQRIEQQRPFQPFSGRVLLDVTKHDTYDTPLQWFRAAGILEGREKGPFQIPADILNVQKAAWDAFHAMPVREP